MIILKTQKQIDNIRKSCKIAAYVLKLLKGEIKPGITTKYLNDLAEDLCHQRGAVPGFKNYKGFPYSICASKNNEIVHGFPKDIPLIEGDILSIDFGVLYKGWYADSAFTTGVGNIPNGLRKLLDTGEKCLYDGIEALRSTHRIGDISYAIQTRAETNGYSIIKGLVGHGVGRKLHEFPQIPNWGKKGGGYILKPGSVVAIEPMLNMGSPETIMSYNAWTISTADNLPSVHFEHTVAVHKNGIEVLTNRN